MTMTGTRKNQFSLRVSWKTALNSILLIAFLIAAIWVVSQSKGTQYFSIKSVKIIGAKHLDHQEVQQALLAFVDHGFFSVEVDAVKDKLIQMPWVADVSVRRIWPDQVIINVTERKPIAHWNNSSLLSSGGDLFNPDAKTTPEDLPLLFGPDGKQIYVMQYFNRINTLLTPLHFTVSRLELTPAHLWNVTLNNGMKLTVDHKDFLTRLNHFVKVYPKLVGDRVSDVDYIDLRYSNGLAVKWKTDTHNV